MAALYIPNLFPSDTVLVQRAKISGGTMTVLECIHAFTYSDGVWTASGDTVSVTAGDGDRSIKAVFTLDNTSSNAAFPMAFYSERNGKTKPVYVISFQIGSYECQGMDDLADFITDVSINGILLVDAKVISTGEERHLILGVEDDSEETRTQIEMLKKLRIDSREDEETKILLQQAESIYQQLADQDVRKELAAQIERFEQQLAANPVQAKKEAAALANLLEKLGREYFAFFQIPDKYIESFLDWYEDQQKDYYDQGWRPRD